METERETVAAFVARVGITMTVDYSSGNPNWTDTKEDASSARWHAEASHWKCKLSRKGDGRRTLTTYFSMGPAHSGKEPTAEEVLNSLAMDAAGIDNARSFEDWASEHGYDTDSRKAERIFHVCERQAKQLLRFLGDNHYQHLLFETENL